jgi:hypothetical protein
MEVRIMVLTNTGTGRFSIILKLRPNEEIARVQE